MHGSSSHWSAQNGKYILLVNLDEMDSHITLA